ncbi:WGR domain-containing protein [Rhizobium viscosum]|uniref:WGR domain-containing protein n=1 Tax=Rhizobium viscosum TaxID=1673 RepID=UPI0035E416F2
MFGETSLIRCWRRIDSRGQRVVHVFKTEPEAVDLFLKLLRIKRGRIYRSRTA